MALASLKEKLPEREKRANVVIDLSDLTGEEGSTVTFREPGVSEILSPSKQRVTQLRINRAAISEEMASLCILLARCHVPDGPGDAAKPEDFADIALKSPEAFLRIAGGFGAAYPVNLEDEAESLKNDGGTGEA